MAAGKGRGKKTKGAKGQNQTRSARAGLQFPVGRVSRYLRQGGYSKRIGSNSVSKPPRIHGQTHLTVVATADRRMVGAWIGCNQRIITNVNL